MKKYILCLWILISISSCGPQVYFEQSQPANVKNESKIPKMLQGTYGSSENDGITLIIDDYTFELISEDLTMFGADSIAKIQLSDSVVLKYYKRNYFLSRREGQEEKWDVTMIIIKDDSNFYTLSIDGEDQVEVEKLKGITTVRETTDSNGEIKDYFINPTKKELEKMLQENLFSAKMTFTKIKN